MKKFSLSAIYLMAALAMALAMGSCKKEAYEIRPPQDSMAENLKTRDEEPSDKMVLGKRLPNPYSVKNMQIAYESMQKQGLANPFKQEFSITPTHLYVRFSVSDTTDYSLLVDSAVELFTYPLDYEILEEGLVYDGHSSSPPYYLYGVVPVQTQMPNIELEVLEECYIPDSNDPALMDFLDRLEYESFLLTGNINPFISFEDLTRAKPSGTIMVYNNTPQINRYEGVQSVKVRVHNFVKYDTDYTNKDGLYQMSKNFIISNIHYSVIYENETGFKIWGNYAFLAPAEYSMGWHSNTGYSINIYTNSKAWLWSTVNNGTYIYRQTLCSIHGITKPANDLRIWTFRMNGNWGGSAPMAKHVSIPSSTFSALLSIFGITNLLQYVNLVLPDIFILQDYTSTLSTYSCLFHELSHASHFAQVGGNYWRKYITGIVANLGYGNGNGLYCGYIGVGEMWGNFFGYISEKEYFGASSIGGVYDWYKPQILKDLYNNIPLTPLQIYDCLLPNINSHSKLKTKLKSNYGHATQIDNIFTSYGF